jgi:hypothetical protein
MDQLALAAVLARRWPKVALLDDRYNYPLPLRVRLQSPWRESQLSNLVHIHYHRWFNQPGFLRRLVPTLDPDDPVGQWLDEQLPFLPHLPIDQKCKSDLDRRATKRSAA